MGMFLAVSAFRNVDVPKLVNAIGDEHGVAYSVPDERDPVQARGPIDVFESAGGWTTVV